MLYFATPSGPKVRDAMHAGLLGCITTPAQGTRPLAGVPWCADNGRFGNGWPGYWRWAKWLAAQPPDGCRFAVAPDVPFDAAATLRRYGPAGRYIRRLGYPAALAAQDGLERLTVPWGKFDVLFIGGTTEWKLGPGVRGLIAECRARGIPVHLARVNSQRRLEYAAAIGCDSADGTYAAFGPDKNLPALLGWLRQVNDQLPLWEVVS